MGWQDLLAPTGPEEVTLPWAGGKKVHSLDRTWALKGRQPPEHGWYTFTVDGGRTARLKDREPLPAEPDFSTKTLRGYVVGDRFIQDGAAVDPDPTKLIQQTEQVYCVEPGLERFTRAKVFRDREGRLIYLVQEWPEGPEIEVLEAYQDRKDSVTGITGVTPALDLAFRWISWGRERAEEARREAERLAEEERQRIAAEEARAAAEAERAERLQQALRDAGTGAGRRNLARYDFEAAARAALALSGAELLDCRESAARGEMVVQYRYRHRRLECTCDRYSMRIIDAGVCLDDHRGTKGDTFFTLESLPTVIGEAMDTGQLVVWRHAPGDPGNRYDDEDW
jgi:hypothetical protein